MKNTMIQAIMATALNALVIHMSDFNQLPVTTWNLIVFALTVLGSVSTIMLISNLCKKGGNDD